MSWEDAVRTISAEVGSAVLPYRFVNFAADGQVDYSSAAQGRVDGISMEDGDTKGKVIPVAIPDGAIVKITASAAITKGAEIGTTNAGKAVTLGSSNGNRSYGVALEAATADGDVISMQFTFKGQVNA
jgi:hypothetical protein